MKENHLSNKQLWGITVLRMSIGWYILYQGIIKFYNPMWSSKGYLGSSDGPFSYFFLWLADNATWLTTIDKVNIYGQLAIGSALILGLFSRQVIIAAISMLGLYYLAHPPFIGLSNIEDGILVNDLFILIVGLVITALFPTSQRTGLDIIFRVTNKIPISNSKYSNGRRE